MEIGEWIAQYRKDAGFTQEMLGEAVGVSGQAVSKWEKGGVPDTMLLPNIAKTLGVTVDALFGMERAPRDLTDDEMYSVICEFVKARSQDREKYPAFDFFDFIIESFWSVHTASIWPAGVKNRIEMSDIVNEHSGFESISSQIINDSGNSYISLLKDIPFVYAVKDTDGMSEKILTEENFGEFFAFLADSDARRAILYTLTAPQGGQYTAKSMSDKIGISLEKFEKIAPILCKYRVIGEYELTLDDVPIKVYSYWGSPELRSFFVMSYLIIHSRQCYYNYVNNRTKPYFSLK